MSENKIQEIESSPQFIERLRQETHEQLVSRFRYLLIFASLFYTVFLGLDYAISPQNIKRFLVIRFIVLADYLIGLALLQTDFGRKIVLPFSVWSVWLSGFGISVMTIFLGGFTSDYYIGIMLAIFVAGLFLTWRLTATAICGVATIISYFAVNLLFSYTSELAITRIMSPIFFLGGAVLIAVFANVGQEKTRRRDLAMRIQIEKANEELKDLDKAKMRFFSNVSHELRTPLTLILGPLEAMQQGQPGLDTSVLLSSMETNARRLLRQVNTLLDFAKIDAGKLQCKFVYGNIGQVLSELYSATRPHAERRKITLTLEGAEHIPDSIMDVDKAETIAANLISNAIKFTPDGGKISIRSGHDEEKVWFEVEDSGPGIPKEQQEKIFERFLQLDDTLSRKHEGTGLGLAMVQELTKLHSGMVRVRSEVGVGTSFTVEFPRRPEEKPIDRRRIIGRRKVDQLGQERTISMLGAAYETRSGTKTLIADVAGSKLGGGMLLGQELKQSAPPDAQKVLVVDDNPDLRMFMASNLAADYRIAMAGDGVEGLETAHAFQPDLIISDIMMPRMDGYEFCRQIRQDKSLASIPIILATSKSGGEAVAAGLETGANDYLAKPFEIRELKARAAAQLRARRLESSLNERDSRLAAIGQMTSSIVHDLKNPLSSIIAFAEIAKEDAQSEKSKSILQDLEPIIKESDRLSRMIAEVLDFARGYASDVKLEPTALAPYMLFIVSSWKDKMEKLGISLVIDNRADEKMQIDLDQDRMMRVMENLLKNALEAMAGEGRDPKGKHVWLHLGSGDGKAFIRMADDGPGIPDEIAAHLFEPFTTARKKSGTGLGLATVRNLVKAQGGEIVVIPKGQEGGAVFEMRFPLKK